MLQKHRIEKLLVVNEAVNLKGLLTVKDIQKKQDYLVPAKDTLADCGWRCDRVLAKMVVQRGFD
ncbi:MAG: hypothetical protein R3C26_11860 [Calditrichia bacterium]